MYGPSVAIKRAEYINVGLYVFATMVLVSGFVALLISNQPEPGLVLLLVALGVIFVVNVHDLFAHLAGIDCRLTLIGFDIQLALVEFTVPMVHAVGALLTFLAVLYLFIQVPVLLFDKILLLLFVIIIFRFEFF